MPWDAGWQRPCRREAPGVMCSSSTSLSLPLSTAFLWALGRGKVSMATEDRRDHDMFWG